MRIRQTILILLALVVAAPAAMSAAVTLDSLLQEMTDFNAVARWPQPEYTCRQSSSYDRARVAPDKPGWFANNDFSQYIRAEDNQGRHEQVMMDADGPGAIVRFWLTTGKNKKGVLRVYLDGNSTPTLTFPSYDLVTGDLKLAAPLLQPHPGYSATDNGGSTLMLPIPYAKHCKVTWEEAGEGPRYYQIDYRTYPAGTAVETFTRETLDAARSRIAAVGKNLSSPPASEFDHASSADEEIAAGKSVSLDLPTGPAAVSALEFQIEPGKAEDLEQTLRTTIVQLKFDGRDTVWCPVGDFFGSGVGVNPLKSWYRTVRADGTMICRWVMPYAKTARVTVLNLGAHNVHVGLRAGIRSWTWDERSMHFHAAWHHESGLATPPVRDWNYVSLGGRGVYVGDTLALYNPVAAWYGEGDEKIRVDGEAFPSWLGTGMEDYYDFSFAPRGLMQTPFANQVRVGHPMTRGYNVLTRTRNLDGIPFSKSFDFNFELISWQPTILICAATTYWYAFPQGTSNVKPQPKAAQEPVLPADAVVPWHRPGAIECEKLKLLAKSGDFPADEQDMEPFTGGRWSDQAQLLVKPAVVGDYVDIQVPAVGGEPRRLILYATQAPDYGTLKFWVDGKVLRVTFDGYAKEVRLARALDLGVVTPHSGSFTLRVEVAGANPAATGGKYLFGLDCVVLKTL